MIIEKFNKLCGWYYGNNETMLCSKAIKKHFGVNSKNIKVKVSSRPSQKSKPIFVTKKDKLVRYSFSDSERPRGFLIAKTQDVLTDKYEIPNDKVITLHVTVTPTK